MFPFQTPLYARLLMSEIHDRGLDFAQVFFQPNLTVTRLNLEAVAEFAWNSDGRTPEEFAISWAVRHGVSDEARAARAVRMLEYPERALSASMRANRMWIVVDQMVRNLRGEEEPSPDVVRDDPLRGFEFQTHSELKRTLGLCREAVQLSQSVELREVGLGAELVRRWIALFERYALLMEIEDKAARRERFGEMVRAAESLRPAWEAWMAELRLSPYHRKVAKEKFEEILEIVRTLRRTRSAQRPDED
jgi:hypothetical protein